MFKVGDKVYCPYNGHGTVFDITPRNDRCLFNISISFGRHVDRYTESGELFMSGNKLDKLKVVKQRTIKMTADEWGRNLNGGWL